MAVERDFRVLGEPSKGMGRRMLRGALRLVWTALAGLAGYAALKWLIDDATWRRTDYLFPIIVLGGAYAYQALKDRIEMLEGSLEDVYDRLNDLER